jgi:hypothetical protein
MGITPVHEQTEVKGTRPDGESFCFSCDVGVASLVKKLNESGAMTTYSCEATGSENTPYIMFRVPSKNVLSECVKALEKEYLDRYSIIINATKTGSVSVYCTNNKTFLRSWFSKLVKVSELIIIIPKKGEQL